MVRGILVGLGIFAAINLIGLALLIAWLVATDRMDGERFRTLREMIGTPVTVERQSIQRAAHEAQAAAQAEEERRRLAVAPRTSAERVAEIDRVLDEAQIRRRIVEEEARLLGRSLEERAAQLREQEQRLARVEEAHRERIESDNAARRDAQFRKTVQLLESAPPKQAKEWLLELVSTGRRAEAVRYLDAMNRFAASRALRELKSAEETALAADLLEALRRRTLDGADSAR